MSLRVEGLLAGIPSVLPAARYDGAREYETHPPTLPYHRSHTTISDGAKNPSKDKQDRKPAPAQSKLSVSAVHRARGSPAGEGAGTERWGTDRWGGSCSGCRRPRWRCCPRHPSSATTRGAACGRGPRFMQLSACARRATTRARAAATLVQTAAAAPTPSSTRRRRPRTPRPCACTSGRPSPTARQTSPP